MEGKDKMGPMFPRLHINDAEKGGPRAPPRNKMALYEQLTIPSQRSTHSIQMPPRHPSETQYNNYSDLSLTTPSGQAEPENKPDEDDYMVPIFIHSVPSKNSDTDTNNTNNTGEERVSPSYSPFFHRSSNSQTAGVPEHDSFTQEGGTNTTDIEEEIIFSSDPTDAPQSDHEVFCDVRNDSDSETSILDAVCEPAVTPDDVVGVIGQKRFWKARRAIVNQQRVFAVQLFELHRLIEVQKLIAASPHLLLEFEHEHSPENKLPSDLTLKEAAPSVPQKRKASFKKSTREIESSTEISVEEKASPPHSYPNGPMIGNSPSQPSTISSIDHKTAFINPYSNQPQGHQWLIPFISPSEGLVYKPYPGAGPVCPPPPQYHYPSFPQHGYFPPYTMPVMNTPSPFSGSWSQQMGPGPSRFSACESDYGRYGESTPVSEDVGVQASTASSAVEVENMLPLFPMAPADGGPESSTLACVPEGPTRVIKAVARNGSSASESAARIFRSIQEERKQFYEYDSV